jgi:hypothetical protein
LPDHKTARAVFDAVRSVRVDHYPPPA